NDAVFQVSNAFDETQPAYKVLHAIDFDSLGADVDIAPADSFYNVRQGHFVGAHGIRVHVDLIFAHQAANRRRFADPAGRQQGVSNIPVLDSAKRIKVPAAGHVSIRVAAFQCVPEDLAQRRGVGPEH